MKRNIKKAVSLLLAGIMCVTLTGCAGDTTKIVEWKKDDTKATEATGEKAGNDKAATGMGRYIEKTVLELDEYGGSAQLQELTDGSLVYFNTLWKYVSVDNGETWNMEETNWLYELNTNNYFIDSAIAKDGSILIEYMPYSDNENLGVEAEKEAKYMLVEPDGEQRELVVDLDSTSTIYLRDHNFDDNGRLFMTSYDNSVYEVDTTSGNTSTFLNVGDRIYYMQCQNTTMLCVGYDDIYLYDMETKTRIEDMVLTEFIRSNYGSSDASNAEYYNFYAFFGEEKVVYIAGEKGLYRHVIGGSSMEQVIDGGLSSFGNPSHGVVCARMVDNQEFLVCFSDYKIVKFTYDPNISTVPNNSLTVYSLTENTTIKQAIATYQTENPDIHVEYEIGIDGEGVTREDALKNLSTRLVEGSGPDVLVVDDMPLDSYIDKGILMDISEVADQIDSKEGLFMNLIAPFYEDNSLYMIPAEFQLPVIADDQNDILGDYSAIADKVEQLRKDNPGMDIMGAYTARNVMRKFSMVCAPAWKSEEGKLNEEKIREFLAESKRIYEAQMSGLPVEKIQEDSSYDNSIYFYNLSAGSYLIKSVKLLYGNMFTIDTYASAVSVQRNVGFENTGIMTMNGQSSNVYIPRTMLGINAAARNMEGAKTFLMTVLGNEVQGLMYEGFPMNKMAFETRSTIDENYIGTDGSYMMCVMSDEEGNTFTWNVYWPTDEQVQTLKEWITAADTPYIPDSVLEEAVYTEGAEYIKGNIDIDTAMKQIQDKIAIYMAE